MGATTPQSTIKLYNAPEVNTRAGDTLLFDSAANREAYFATKVVETDVNCTVVKKRYNTIKVKASMATLESCNYLSFINPSYGNKLFYAFIMSTDYLNNEVSLVTYNIDWWMTDMFNVEFRDDTQMVREHLTKYEHYLMYEMPSGAKEYAPVEKMYTQEPLSCDVETEKRKQDVAGDNIGYLNNTLGISGIEAWNIVSNNGKVWKVTGESWPSTDHVPSNMIHVICFTIPDIEASEEAEDFRRELQKLLYGVMTCHTDTAPLKYYPYFIYDPTGTTAFSTSITTPAFYFLGRHKYADTERGELSVSTSVIEDSFYARPYMMVGCEDMSRIQKIIDYLNSSGNVSSILGCHEMPISMLDEFFYSCALTNGAASLPNTAGHIDIPTPKNLEAFRQNDDPKLHYFPYSYYVFEGVNNQSRMEMKYELSKVNSTYGVRLWKGVTVNASGVYLYVRPESYRGDIKDTVSGEDLGTHTEPLDYMMVYSDFPEIPYNTDAYAAFIAGKARELMSENTREGLYYKGADYIGLQAQEMTSKLSVASNGLSAIGSALTLNPSGAINGAAGMINAGASAESASLKSQAMDIRASMMDAASNTLLNPLAGTEENPIYDNFQMSRGAYIMPNFHPGSSGGIMNLSSGAQRPGIIVRCVTRSAEFVAKYANFFKRFGYTTTDVKKPAICVYMSSPNDDKAAYIPIPEQAGWPAGKGYSDTYFTQTKNMKVTGICGDSAMFIEHMFDAGVAIKRYVPRDN